MILTSNQREKLLEDLKSTIKEANKMNSVVEWYKKEPAGEKEDKKQLLERYDIDLFLLTSKIGLIEGALIANEIDF